MQRFQTKVQQGKILNNLSLSVIQLLFKQFLSMREYKLISKKCQCRTAVLNLLFHILPLMEGNH